MLQRRTPSKFASGSDRKIPDDVSIIRDQPARWDLNPQFPWGISGQAGNHVRGSYCLTASTNSATRGIFISFFLPTKQQSQPLTEGKASQSRLKAVLRLRGLLRGFLAIFVLDKFYGVLEALRGRRGLRKGLLQ